MAYARIPLDFDTMDKTYRDYNTLTPDIAAWKKAQNDWEKAENEKRAERNSQLDPGQKPEPMLPISTTCCMQASLSFNAAGPPIPQAGSRDRDNTLLKDGRYYILTVDEFRAYLTYRYGPTDHVTDFAQIKGKRGVLIFGSAHIELWDGDQIFQSFAGAQRRASLNYSVDTTAVMGGAILSASPRWFWQIGPADSADADSGPLAWAKGWWVVYDGNYYYYFFYGDGTVSYIETRPNPKWTPPKKIGNHGAVTEIANGLSVLWDPTEPGGTSTKEDFTRLNWTSTTEMNGVSNKYSPLYARKM